MIDKYPIRPNDWRIDFPKIYNIILNQIKLIRLAFFIFSMEFKIDKNENESFDTKAKRISD